MIQDLNEEEEQALVQAACNAVILAGQEMGADGDHWPLIKATLHGMIEDYRDLRIERAVSKEMEDHLGTLINDYESLLNLCPRELAEQIAPMIAQMREVYEARFVPPERKIMSLKADQDSDLTTNADFVPWRSAQALILSLTEDEHEQAE
ncbi:MAG: hypothetical protein IPI58_01295 [Alphaproteobacteria bacterium]|nr:MAG: hypothetical protein IPI58_01295 [Alphaproteobacteria bacterium]